MKEDNARIGMKVICKNEAYSFGRLREGREYTVEAAYDGSPVVLVNGAYHNLEGFEEAENQPTAKSILAAMRDAIKAKDELINKVIQENTKLKEENDRAWAIIDRLTMEKEVKP